MLIFLMFTSYIFRETESKQTHVAIQYEYTRFLYEYTLFHFQNGFCFKIWCMSFGLLVVILLVFHCGWTHSFLKFIQFSDIKTIPRMKTKRKKPNSKLMSIKELRITNSKSSPDAWIVHRHCYRFFNVWKLFCFSLSWNEKNKLSAKFTLF